jgi:isopentenyl-diphosphate Delta-isomerase
MELVVLVDRDNKELGVMEKMQAHKEGLLHRCFSIIIFNTKCEMLLQQRAKEKYHCPALWSNTCCSHPRPGESYDAAVHRRLKEEMGFDCKLQKIYEFVYKASFSNGLTEHEHDSVFVGKFDGTPNINRAEAMAFKWAKPDEVFKDASAHPEKYTEWFKEILESGEFQKWMKSR